MRGEHCLPPFTKEGRDIQIMTMLGRSATATRLPWMKLRGVVQDVQRTGRFSGDEGLFWTANRGPEKHVGGLARMRKSMEQSGVEDWIRRRWGVGRGYETPK